MTKHAINASILHPCLLKYMHRVTQHSPVEHKPWLPPSMNRQAASTALPFHQNTHRTNYSHVIEAIPHGRSGSVGVPSPAGVRGARHGTPHAGLVHPRGVTVGKVGSGTGHTDGFGLPSQSQTRAATRSCARDATRSVHMREGVVAVER